MEILKLNPSISYYDKAIEIESRYTKYSYIKDDDNHSSFILIKDDNIIGGINISYIYENADIDFIYIVKEERGNGYSKLLLSYIIEYLVNKRVNNIMLEVNENNLIAIKLYESFNFKLISRRVKYYNDKDDALIYKLEV